MDHETFLGDTLDKIAFEKAGILKRGVTCVVGRQQEAALDVIERQAARVGAPLLVHGQHWHVTEERDRLIYQDETGLRDLQLPVLPGAHQVDNAGMALAVLRHLGQPDAALDGAVTRTEWPARMQRLRDHPLARAHPEAELWLDGGHNPDAGRALAAVLADLPPRETVLVCGMQNTKDVAGYMRHLAGAARRLVAVAIPGASATLSAEATAEAAARAGLEASTAPDIYAALRQALAGSPHARVLICGSLYLAGAVLAQA
jgi:dihydrofolate synthase/folylpolyglutamate synthase